MTLRTALIAAITTVSCAEPEPVDTICTDVGCGDSTTITMASGLSVQELAQSRVRICMNERCVDQVMEQGAFRFDVFRDGFRFSGGFGELAANLELQVSISEEMLSASAWADGDIYTLEVWSSLGDKRVDQRWSATYTLLRPNGPRCTPVCQIGRLDASNAQ